VRRYLANSFGLFLPPRALPRRSWLYSSRVKPG